jgi:hypothetical protein
MIPLKNWEIVANIIVQEDKFQTVWHVAYMKAKVGLS